MKLYIGIIVDEYIPTVEMTTTDKAAAVQWAKSFAETQKWNNAKESETGEVYFNQEESGCMENAVSVQEVNTNVDDITLLYHNVERRLSAALQPENTLSTKNGLVAQARDDLRRYMRNNGYVGNF